MHYKILGCVIARPRPRIYFHIMVSPQKENGYTPIANEIMEQLCKINLSSYQSRLLFAVWRKTYGYNKKEDWLSNSQLVELTGLKKQHVSRAKKELIERKLVTSTGDKIQFNKCYSQWRELPKSVTKKVVTNTGNGVTNTGAIVTSTGDHSNQYRGTQKNKITKETIQKKGYGEFKNVKLTDIEYQKLIDGYGEQLVLSTIETMSSWLKAKGKTYKDYYAALLNWLKKEKKEQPKKTWQDELQANLERSYQESQRNNNLTK